MDYRVFVQARMSSGRFPGKMLAPFAGRPMVAVVLGRLAAVVGRDRVVLATSADATDAPLADYCETLGFPVFRGDLANVFARFQACARAYPAEWIVRICGDSPMIDAKLIPMLLEHCAADVDLVTNVAVRSYPPGQSVEILNARTLAGIDASQLAGEEQEHLTQVFYRNPQSYKVRNIIGSDPHWSDLSFVVDTLDDLRRLEPLAWSGEYPAFASGAVSA
jgi:spore coat polysaccharide biosynthesis protein SpsF